MLSRPQTIINPSWLVYNDSTVWNTRFNPTVNGFLHMGHLLTALVNECEAHRSGGKFIVRFDDNQPDWISYLGMPKIEEYRKAIIEDLAPYVEVDEWISQFDNPDVPELIPLPEMPIKVTNGKVYMPLYEFIPEWIPDAEMTMFPYAPHYTAEKVWLDFQEGINWLIRGVDLASEYAFYEYICEMASLPRVRQTYIPRLRRLVGDRILPLSKTNGGTTIQEMTAAYGEDGVIEILRAGCLIDAGGDFAVDNLLPDPVIMV